MRKNWIVLNVLFFLNAFCFISYAEELGLNPDMTQQKNPLEQNFEEKTMGRKIEPKVRALRLYHDNYFLLYDSPVKFQVSIQYRMILPNQSRDETGFYFAYTQKSLWDLWNWSNSAPFLESNYSPELFYRYDYGQNNPLLRWLQFGLLHESNGMGNSSQAQSRSWNRIYLETKLHFGKKDTVVIIPRIWFPFMDDDNADIEKYYGYGELLFQFNYFNKFYESKIEIKIRKGWDQKISKLGIEMNKTIGPFILKAFDTVFPIALYFQVWHGYGETLLQYNSSESRFRAGFALILN